MDARRGRRLRAGPATLAAAALLALALPACRAGTGAPPEGAVVLGFVNMEGVAEGSFPEIRAGAEAAVAYLNDERGGVGGQPLVLETCRADGTAPTAAACAVRLVASHPVAVLGGIDLGAGGTLGVLADGGVPYLGATPTLGDELTAPNAFLFTGGSAADLLGQARYLTEVLHARRLGLVHLDLPGLLSTAIGLAGRFLAQRGVEDLAVVAESSDAADLVPALATVTAGDPDAVVALFDAPGCTRIMQARAALDLDVAVYYPSVCASPAVLATGGGGAEGARLTTGYLPYDRTTDPEVALYRRALADHGGTPSVLSQAGFSLVMNTWALLSELGPDATPAELAAALGAAVDRPNFMAHPYTCDGRQVVLLPAVCNASVRILRPGDGGLVDVGGRWIDGSDLLAQALGR